jgi:hypothetical protein
MIDTNSHSVIAALRRKWVFTGLLSAILLSAGIGFLLGSITEKLFGWPRNWGLLYGCVALLVLLLLQRVWTVKEKHIARLLDQTYPQLQESSHLLLRQGASLNRLEQWQQARTGSVLTAIDSPLSIQKKLWGPAVGMLILLAAGWLILQMPSRARPASLLVNQMPVLDSAKKEILFPQLAAIKISITPPAYTGKASRIQQAFNLVAEEGALVKWALQTTMTAKAVSFIFNDQTRIRLLPQANQQWKLQRRIDTSGFYQLDIDGQLSALYKIEIIADKAPVIIVQSPEPNTTIDYGEIPMVKLNVRLTDDYAVKEAAISATIASGSGEAVKFKEQKISLQHFTPGGTQYQLQQMIALSALGMAPGDELYFYIQATDSHQQQTKSDIYIVRLPDTAQLMSMDGFANTLSLKPEYFRSQRQIIIDTEQLLKDKDTISEERFKTRSNNLGIDQQLLRLRYGKFLGDEAESGEEGAGGLDNMADFSNADKIADAFTDKHDNAEDATFYDPQTKKQLRATLTEMWAAELRLRTFVPRDALPFEYKALRLLKDLQQQSRVYVAKTNLRTAPLDLKKRLSADLSKIDMAVYQKNSKIETDREQAARTALSILDRARQNGKPARAAIPALQQAAILLQQQAIRQPAVYLDAVQAMKRVQSAINANRSIDVNDIEKAQLGFQHMLAQPGRQPAGLNGHSKQDLYKQYFDNLQKKQP